MKRIRIVTFVCICFPFLCFQDCSHRDEQRTEAVPVGGESKRILQPIGSHKPINEQFYFLKTEEFVNRIERKTSAEQLREWALNVLAASAGKKERFCLPHSKIPESVLKLDPPVEPFVIVNPNLYVTVYWGGGFGYWGLFIASNDNKIPNEPDNYVLEWAPGVEVFHDIQ